MKICPHCKTAALQETSYHNQKIDVCRRCAGLWFEQGEFNAVLNQQDTRRDDIDIEAALGPAIIDTQMRCPECEQTLTRHHLMDNFALEVEACPYQHGIWIERDELKAAEQSPQLQSSLDALNQKRGWKAWLFQFITHMPVEYNIRPANVPWVTYLLIILNTLLFVAPRYDEQYNVLYEFGLMIPAQITQGAHWETLIYSQFLHASWIHLLGNMYFLWLTGDNLEDALGHFRFLAIYLLCCVVAAVAQTYSTPLSTNPVLGASGAIAGLFGMYLLWFRRASLTFMLYFFQKKVAPWFYFLIWIGISIYNMSQGAQGTAFIAHFAGFAAGIIWGLTLKNWVREHYPILKLLDHERVIITR